MALFPEMSTYYKGRTHTSLVVSEGMAPAERYIPSALEDVKFQYNFGPEGNTGVVIPKGKAVAIAGLEWDYETEKHVPALKVANGKTDTLIGVNHHNVYERRRDRFSGNQPTIITREYIEVPLFGDKDLAKAIQFGAAWAPGANSKAAADALIGKYVAIDEHGNYTLKDGAYTNVIGQCLGVEVDLPPAGYLQYFMEMDDERWKEFQKQMSYAPSPGRTKDAEWNDIGTYPLGTGYLADRKSFLKNFKAGIPFLTDGYFKARKAKTYTLASTGVTAKTSGHVTIEANQVACTDPVGAALFIKLPLDDKLTNENVPTTEVGNYPEFGGDPVPAGIAVVIGGTVDEDGKITGGTAVNQNNVHVDYTNNQIVIYLTEKIDVAANVIIKAVVLESQVPGIPTGWDFSQSYGAARILLSAK